MACLALFLATTPVYAQPQYTATDLGYSGSGPGGGAYGALVNNKGEAAGSGGYFTYGVAHGYLYSGGTTTDIGSLGGFPTYVYGLNNNAQVVGVSNTPAGSQHAFLYSRGTGMSDLGALLGGTASSANGINDSGQVVGSLTAADGKSHAFRYAPGSGLTDLASVLGATDSSAADINSSGQIVGWFTAANGIAHAFLIDGTTVTDLGSLISNGTLATWAVRMNDHGQVLLFADHWGGPVYLYSGGSMHLIDPLPGDTAAFPGGLNNLGDVVGESASCCDWNGYLYRAGTLTNLNSLGIGYYPVAWDINDRGQIVVWNGEEYLLTPAATTGTISVTTNLSAATFTVTGPATYTGSGTSFTQTNAPLGTYTIAYATIPGFITPLSQSQTLAANGSLAFSGNYQLLPATPATAQYGQPGSSPRNASPSFAEPVNTATGNYYSTAADLSVPGRGLAFVFSRSYNSADTYSGPLGIGWTHSLNLLLLQNADNSVSIKEGDGGIIGFTPSGGNYTPATPGVFDSLAKNGDGSFTLTRKNQTRLTWTAVAIVPPGTAGQQRLTRIVDRSGNSQTLSYDSLGNLATVTDSAGRLYSFSYDGNGHLIQLTDPLGRALRYSYDAFGRLTSFQDATGATTSYAYDASNRLVSATDPRGNVYLRNTYDSQGRVITQENARNFTTTFAYNAPATGTTTITDPLGKVTKHVLDGLGRLSQQIDALGGSTSYTYDNNNLRLSVTDPLGRVQSFTYDANGNTLSMTDPAGKTGSFTYDAKNNLLTSTDRLGRTATFAYDSAGNLLTSFDPGGNTNAFTYDSFGEVLTARNGRGFATSFQYDSAGNLTKTADALGGTITMAYDGVGRLTSVQNQLGKTATRAYDTANRLLSVTDPLNNSTQFQYDANGNLTKITDANGKQTQYVYDATNKLAEVTDAIGGVTQHQYNGNTDLTGVTDAAGHATTYAYDSLRRMTVITDPLGRQRRYGYDPVGNVTSTVDGNGKTNSFGYDALNRLTSMSLSDGKSVAYTYDAVGNRLTMLDWHGATSYVYDVLNRATSVTTPDGKTVGYTYDAVGNRASLRYPDARTVQYTYDARNRLTRVTDWASKSTNYAYDAASNLSGFTHPNGAASSYQYDFANRLTSIVNRSGSATLSSFTYALDKAGNRTQMTTSANGVNRFGYDGLYRLTSWTPPSGQSTLWTYDAVGNRKTMVSSAGTTNYSYDPADQLLAAGTTSFTYDGNGNQLTKTAGSATTNYAWDALNRLTTVTTGSATTQYQYDGDGNRVAQQVAAGTYAYVQDTATSLPVVLNENGPDGNLDYVYGLSMISATAPSFQYFHQFDGLGSAINLTDASGAQKANYSYDPWGKLTVALDPVGTKDKYKFTGEQSDSNGLVFLRARYYDVSIGRLLSRDPLGGSPYIPKTQHRYQYSLASPIRYTDATHCCPNSELLTYPPKALGNSVFEDMGADLNLSAFGMGGMLTAVGSLAAVGFYAFGQGIKDRRFRSQPGQKVRT